MTSSDDQGAGGTSRERRTRIEVAGKRKLSGPMLVLLVVLGVVVALVVATVALVWWSDRGRAAWHAEQPAKSEAPADQ